MTVPYHWTRTSEYLHLVATIFEFLVNVFMINIQYTSEYMRHTLKLLNVSHDNFEIQFRFLVANFSCWSNITTQQSPTHVLNTS